MILLILLQVAEPLPTLQLIARVEAREVVVEQRGQASLTVRAEPDAGSRVDVVETPPATGQRVIRNYRADIDARAFNKAVAKLYELTGAIEKAAPSASRGEAIAMLRIGGLHILGGHRLHDRPHIVEDAVELKARILIGADPVGLLDQGLQTDAYIPIAALLRAG